LCPVGPLTNLALALELDPSIAGKVKSVTVMGGSLAAGGNVTQYAEANIWQDPHAANKVFSAEWNVNMVGLDVTHQVTCSPEEFAGFTQSAPVLGGFLNEVAQYYFDFHLKENGFRGCYMHDPTAVIAILRPDLFEVDVQPLEVILDGDRLGQTVVSNEGGRMPVNVYTAVDASAVCDLFIETVKSGF
jgi:inosine-uridine nucleoside N-ribohydrolase